MENVLYYTQQSAEAIDFRINQREMSQMRGFDGYHPAIDYEPDVPEPGDIVKVYRDFKTEWYYIAKVTDYNDVTEEYTVTHSPRFAQDAPVERKVNARLVETHTV